MSYVPISDTAIQANLAPVRGRLVRRIAVNQQAVVGWTFAPPNLQFPAGVSVTTVGASGQSLSPGASAEIFEFRVVIPDFLIGDGGTRITIGLSIRQTGSGNNTVEYALRQGGSDADVRRVETTGALLIVEHQFVADIATPSPNAIHPLQMVARHVAGSGVVLRLDWTNYDFVLSGGLFTNMRLNALVNSVEALP